MLSLLKEVILPLFGVGFAIAARIYSLRRTLLSSVDYLTGPSIGDAPELHILTNRVAIDQLNEPNKPGSIVRDYCSGIRCDDSVVVSPSVVLRLGRSETMPGLSIDPVGDHFVLRSKKADGSIQTLELSIEEATALAEMGPSVRQMIDRILNPRSDQSGPKRFAVMDIVDFQLQPEMLGEKLVLFLQVGPIGSSTTALAFPIGVAERLAQEIPPRLAAMRATKMERH